MSAAQNRTIRPLVSVLVPWSRWVSVDDSDPSVAMIVSSISQREHGQAVPRVLGGRRSRRERPGMPATPYHLVANISDEQHQRARAR